MPKFFKTPISNKFNRTLFALALILAGAMCFTPSPQTFAAVSTDKTQVKVTPKRDAGGVTHFVVENSELSEVTMTFDFNTENLKSDVAFPYTATFKPGETEAFTLSPMNTNKEWEYSYTNYYKLGSSVAMPDDYVYSLPYAPGSTHRITQGYNGEFCKVGYDLCTGRGSWIGATP